jgi:putative Mg2+ transporter-C (MgtC) family protein
VIGGATIFTFLSSVVDPNSSSRIAAPIITGVGFIGAGLTLRSETDGRITNLTTAAAVRFAASIGMAIGYQFYFFAIVVTAFAVGVPRIPNISKMIKKGEETCPWRLSRAAKEICYLGCLDCAPAYQL